MTLEPRWTAKMGDTVMTVKGPVAPTAIGFTLPHEHLSCDPARLEMREQPYAYAPTFEMLREELNSFAPAGGGCVVDLTPPGLGRDPAWLARLAEQTGLHVVMATGWYRQSFFPIVIRRRRRSIDDLAALLIGEIRRGVPPTGIRPGIIGEIGTDDGSMTPGEERVHRAAAHAARETGLAVVTHSLRSRVALAQLRVFREEGLDLSRVVIGHADSVPEVDYCLALLEQGAMLSFDLFGLPSRRRVDEDRVLSTLATLAEREYTNRLLLSHDVCSDAQLRAHGGGGFTYLSDVILPRLRHAGINEDALDQMTRRNPIGLLTVQRPSDQPG